MRQRLHRHPLPSRVLGMKHILRRSVGTMRSLSLEGFSRIGKTFPVPFEQQQQKQFQLPPQGMRLWHGVPHFVSLRWTAQRRVTTLNGPFPSVRASAGCPPNDRACLALATPTAPDSHHRSTSFSPVCNRGVCVSLRCEKHKTPLRADEVKNNVISGQHQPQQQRRNRVQQ